MGWGVHAVSGGVNRVSRVTPGVRGESLVTPLARLTCCGQLLGCVGVRLCFLYLC